MSLKIDLKLKIKNLKLPLTILIIIILLALPAPTMAQDTPPIGGSGILDVLGSGLSQLLTLNNPVHLDNPLSPFTLDQSPTFILITPQETTLEEITANIIRKN